MTPSGEHSSIMGQTPHGIPSIIPPCAVPATR
uniref:RNA polymerase Rpc34 subunit family protein n=1 Tax=Arundo donax TaxID=35708 RepID=A0A0A9DZT6_ARUDO